jgi:hypothetical protein|tara:strand:- start:1878 stop:3674 length:1797 start_codon:yes stop_codon:yes gene_type:complete
MPISIYYKNEQTQVCTLRPSPLVSISSNLNKVGGENVGVTYNIILTGTILEDRGSPYALKTQDNSPFNYYDDTVPTGIGPYGQFDNSSGHSEDNMPKVQPIPNNAKLDAIFSKQRAIKALFSEDGQKLEIMPVHGDEPAVICFPRVVSIDFEEGNYVHRCDYTITLEADTLLNKDLRVDAEGNVVEEGLKPALSGPNSSMTSDTIIALSGAFINDFSESWSVEVDDERSENLSQPRTYRITREVTATGKTHYFPSDDGTKVTKIPAWQSARDYVVKRLLPPESGILQYPNVGPYGYMHKDNQIGSGTLNLFNSYGGFNHVRTEDVDMSAGSFSVSETYVIASGTSYEDYNVSISQSLDSAFVNVSIDGTVVGLDTITPSGYGSPDGTPTLGTYPNTAEHIGSGKYQNALAKYNMLSNSGQFGIISDVYKRANNSVALELNSQPTSISLGMNEFNGEITYSLDFDNRPTNIISGVLSENISVNDTYPGDVFATIPVLGRKTGPVLQYIGTRTEYKRDLQIELQMDYTNLHYGNGQRELVTQKPSIVEPTRTQLRQLIQSMSPAYELGVRKYFIEAPQESWSPKTGNYSFSISWTYELDR